jgi:hypothetical protein
VSFPVAVPDLDAPELDYCGCCHEMDFAASLVYCEGRCSVSAHDRCLAECQGCGRRLCPLCFGEADRCGDCRAEVWAGGHSWRR